jgi:hypothetical protein
MIVAFFALLPVRPDRRAVPLRHRSTPSCARSVPEPAQNAVPIVVASSSSRQLFVDPARRERSTSSVVPSRRNGASSAEHIVVARLFPCVRPVYLHPRPPVVRLLGMTNLRRLVRVAAIPMILALTLTIPAQAANAGGRAQRFQNEMLRLVNQTRGAHGLHTVRLNRHLSRKHGATASRWVVGTSCSTPPTSGTWCVRTTHAPGVRTSPTPGRSARRAAVDGERAPPGQPVEPIVPLRRDRRGADRKAGSGSRSSSTASSLRQRNLDHGALQAVVSVRDDHPPNALAPGREPGVVRAVERRRRRAIRHAVRGAAAGPTSDDLGDTCSRW